MLFRSVSQFGLEINTIKTKWIHSNYLSCQNRWQRNERLCGGEAFRKEAHAVIWTSCSRIKDPLLDEGSHVTNKQEYLVLPCPGQRYRAQNSG